MAHLQCDQCGNKIPIGGVTVATRPIVQRGRRDKVAAFETNIGAGDWQGDVPPVPTIDPPEGVEKMTIHQPSGKHRNMDDYFRGPFSQSLVAGALGLSVAALAATAFDMPIVAIPAAGILGFAAWWFPATVDGNRSTWVKTVYKFATSKTSKPEEPKPTPTPWQIDHRHEHGQNSQVFDLPNGVTEAMRNEFVQGILTGGRPTSEGSWIGGGNLFSKAQYASLRGILIAGGMARWKGDAKNQGWELTPIGVKILSKHCLPPSPTTGETGMTPQSPPTV